MGFYKPGANHPTDPRMARLHYLIWALIYAGLLSIILGLFVQRTDDAIGWMMIAAGGVMTVVGAILIYIRSTMTSDTEKK